MIPPLLQLPNRDFAHQTWQYLLGIADRYFRVEVHNPENIASSSPGEEPVIYFANHAGNTFAWDAIMVTAVLDRIYEQKWGTVEFENRMVRPLIAPVVNEIRVMNPSLIKGWWKLMGGIDATARNFIELVRLKQHIFNFPEGERGIFKGWEKRYQIQKFYPGMIKLAYYKRAKLIPVTITGSEWFNPFAIKNPLISQLFKRLGFPTHPIGPTNLLVAGSPSLLGAALPAKLHLTFHPPVRLQRNGVIDDTKVDELNEQLRSLLQQYLDQDRVRYGVDTDPYHFQSLLASFMSGKLTNVLPTHWAFNMIKIYKNTIGDDDMLPKEHEVTTPFSWVQLYQKYNAELIADLGKMRDQLNKLSSLEDKFAV